MLKNLTFKDSNGKELINVYQWDLGRKLYIENSGDIEVDKAPIFHLYKENSLNALPVQSTLDGNYIVVEIPNILLQDTKRITIDMIEYNDANSVIVIASNILCIQSRVKPTYYEYVENISNIFDSLITREVQKYFDNMQDGSPKATFEITEDLLEKEPGIYLNITDGYIYYWDGTELSEKLIQYQAVQIAEESITEVELAKDSVITEKIKDEAITRDKILDGEITKEKIENKAITEDKLNDALLMKALEEKRTFDSVDALNTYISSEYAKAGQIVKVIEGEDNEYQVYILQNTDNGLDKKKINSDEEALNTMVGAELSFDETTRELTLLNLMGEAIGESVMISAGVSGLNMEIESDDEGNNYLVLLDSSMNELARTVLPATGGGGGSYTTMRVRNLLSSTSFTVPYNETDGCSCELKYSFTSVDSDGYDTGNGTVTYEVGGVIKLTTQNLPQGETTVDIGEYLAVGKTNTVKVSVTDSEGTKKSITYYITVSQNYITSTFPELSKQTGSFAVAYTPVGSGNKTIHFKVDDEEIATTVVTASNRQQYQTIPALSHGNHTLKVYMTTILDGYTEPIQSNVLTFGIVAIEDENTSPIVLLMNSVSEVLQYSTVELPFLVYDPAHPKCDVECYVDNELVTTLNVSSEAHTWSYRIMTAGEHTLAIKYGDITESTTITATEVDVAQAETSGLKFYFNAANRSNNEPNPAIYEYTNEDGNTYSVTFNNMNFNNDGWTGNSLNIGVGSSIDINCQPFATDVTGTNGKTLEFNFKAKNVYNYDSMLISCFANEKGIQITPNTGTLSTNATDSIEIQYKDEEEIKISFVISNRNSANEGQNQLIYVYVNSGIAGILKYSTNDNFSQLNASGIHIGSADAAIELYNIRYYEVALSSYQILDNYIADTPDPNVMLERNARNDIFDDNNDVDYDKVSEDCPYLIICCPELPQYKEDVKTGVYGRFVDKLHPERSFTFENAEIDVQGTSSAGYFVKNFKIKFKGGFILINVNEDELVTGYSIYDDNTDVPVSTFCYKADVASSEGANNLILMKIWEETVPYKTPPQESDLRVRQTIDGRPIILYWENTANGELSFRGKYNFNNDKGTPETFGFVDDENHNCQCWEFKDNGLELTEFRGNDFDSLNAKGKAVWTDAFEARFPKDFEDTSKLRRVVSWVVSTDTSKATGEALEESVTYGDVTYTEDTEEYRLAKFKYEFEDYFIKIPTLYYYYFTELFLMVDSRAKNQFITTWDGIHWMFLPYDGDTALGTDNIGALKFGYWLEDTDQVNGTDVYNGQKSVLHINIRKCFMDEIAEIAQSVISQGKLNYTYVKDKFLEHQSAWSEAIFCADTDVKYIVPYKETGTAAYLDMAQGSKATQRDYWLDKRFAYINSKYHVGSARNEYITLRMSEPQGSTVNVVPLDMTLNITPYSHIYVSVNFGQALQTTRGYADEVTVVESGLDRPSDSPVYIYSASQIRDIGDLSAAYVKYCDIGSAINLEKLVLGNSTEGYQNEALETLGIGNNKKLRLIDVRNCTNLTGSLNAGACNNIEEIYADGTKITSVTLPVGGTLKVLRLPETVSSLMISNQHNIEEFNVASYEKLASLYIDNCPTIDVMSILNNAPNLTNVYLADIEWTLDSTDLLDRLLTLGGKSENGEENTAQSVLTGTVHVPTLNTSKKEAYENAWQNLTVTYDNFIEQYPVTFVDENGEELDVQYVDRGSIAVDPVETGRIETPTKESTIDTVYRYNGWDTSLDIAVIKPLTVTVVYSESVRQYTVQYAIEGKIVQTSVVDVYGEAPYEGDIPAKTGMEEYFVWYMFSGWDTEATNVTSDMVINAIFEECKLPSQMVDVTQFDYVCSNNPESTSAYTLAELYAICKSDRYKEYLAVGDEMEILLEDGVTNDASIVFQVYGFNHYERDTSTEDNVQLAHVVFGMKGVLISGRSMNTGNTNSGGWNGCSMRTWLNGTMINALPVMLRDMIESVQVLASAGTQSAEIVTSVDKLFLFSEAEVGSSTSAVPYMNEVSANAETKTFSLLTTTSSRIKKTFNGTGSAQNWWLRSPDASSTTHFRIVNYNGSINSTSAIIGANYGNSVAFGFNIG
ncbi:MAG: hypothetical protein II304_03540 [Bacteroidales bacterium]|nr:hypothetical protein [Bacteroidales bacterium]